MCLLIPSKLDDPQPSPRESGWILFVPHGPLFVTASFYNYYSQCFLGLLSNTRWSAHRIPMHSFDSVLYLSYPRFTTISRIYY